MMNYYLLLVYPVILLGIAVFGMRVSEKGKFTDKYWGLEDSKKLQALAAVCSLFFDFYRYQALNLILSYHPFAILSLQD